MTLLFKYKFFVESSKQQHLLDWPSLHEMYKKHSENTAVTLFLLFSLFTGQYGQ